VRKSWLTEKMLKLCPQPLPVGQVELVGVETGTPDWIVEPFAEIVWTGDGPAGLPSRPLGAPLPGRLSRKGFKFGVSKNTPNPPRTTRSPLSPTLYANPTRGEKLW